MAETLTARFDAVMEAFGAQDGLWPAAVAVSGGGDSLALMYLLADWAKAHALTPPVVLIVDHALQRGSASVARRARDEARRAGLRASVLKWNGAKPESGIEAAARGARYDLMGRRCAREGIYALYAGHTEDDQAETFFLRLARGSGVDGLAAMRSVAPLPVESVSDVKLVRPLLQFSRQELRSYLRDRSIAWFDDPMNSDERFDRVRIRQIIATLEDAGVPRYRVAQASAHFGRAREALDAARDALLAGASVLEQGRYLLDAAALAAAPLEIGLRTLAHALMTVSAAAYRPRFENLAALFNAMTGDGVPAAQTLHGCRIGRAPKRFARFGVRTLIVEKAARQKRMSHQERNAPSSLKVTA